MLLDYNKAFALIDNPFRPLKLLPGVTKWNAMQELERNPLRVHEVPKLIDLYCPSIEPMREHLEAFKKLIALGGGYIAEPAAAGFQSFIILVSGPIGTGKTTLANVMVDWLKKCKPNEREWKVFDPWLELSAAGIEQRGVLDTLAENIQRNTGPGDYCCILIEGLLANAKDRALYIFDKLVQDRIVFLFLLTSDLALLEVNTTNSRHQIEVYKTRVLSADDAIEFVAHRIKYFRRKSQLPDFGAFPLFPFDEDDICDAIETKALQEFEQNLGGITIRLLSGLLRHCLAWRMEDYDANFSIDAVPVGDLADHIIKLEPNYRRMIS